MFTKTEPEVAVEPAPLPVEPAEPAPQAFWGAILVFLLVTAAAWGWIYRGNPRILGAHHGFLHAAIANRFAEFVVPPENPFFSGEPLPYYWFYHFIGYWFSRALQLDLLHTFHLISWIALVVFIVFAGLIGRRCFRSILAGAAIAYLALTGINPLGPGIAVAKHLLQGTPLIRHWPTPVETTFVTDRMADELMVEPLLPAMYVGADWHYGLNLVWFHDIGARAPALALLMVLLYLLLAPGTGWRRYCAVTLTACLLTAFNAVIGMGVIGTLCAASVVAAAWPRIRSAESPPKPLVPVALLGACLAGVVLAEPTYQNMFFRISNQSDAGIHRHLGLGIAMLAADFLLLVPLAVVGLRKVKYDTGIRIASVAIAAGMLLCFVELMHIPKGNEHSLSNATACLLAIPAGAFFSGSETRKPAGSWWTRNNVRAGLVFLAFLPVTICTLAAWASRPAIPLSASKGTLTRLPQAGDLERFYAWIRQETPRQAIFVTDPAFAVKMSGDVSELPALTSRTQFIDRPNIDGGHADLTDPYRDAGFRRQLAFRATQGETLSDQQREYLARFGRPIYIVTYQAERSGLVPRLTSLYGPPLFQQGMVAAFPLDRNVTPR